MLFFKSIICLVSLISKFVICYVYNVCKVHFVKLKYFDHIQLVFFAKLSTVNGSKTFKIKLFIVVPLLRCAVVCVV